MLLFAPLPDTERTATMRVVAAASEELDSYAVFANAVSSSFETFCDELAGDTQSFSLAALFESTANDTDDATPTTNAATTIASFEEDDNSSECDSEIAMLEDNGVWEDEELIIAPSTAMEMSDCAILEDNGVWDAVDELNTPAARLQCAVATTWIVNESMATVHHWLDRVGKPSSATPTPTAQAETHEYHDDWAAMRRQSPDYGEQEEKDQDPVVDSNSDWPLKDPVDGCLIYEF